MHGFRAKFIAAWAIVFAIAFGFKAPAISRPVLQKVSTMLGRDFDRAKLDVAVSSPVQYVAMVLLGALIGAGIGTFLLRVGPRLDKKWDNIHSGDKITGVIGIIIGLLVASPILLLLSSLKVEFLPVAYGVLMIATSLIAIYALSTIRDVLPWYKGQVAKTRTGIKILDTNVIIDGRIHDIIETGFLEGQLYVSRHVVEELQHIADSPDALRRQRGKRGLDVLRLMQDKFKLEVGTKDHLITEGPKEVDSRLVRLAKAIGGDLVTNDMNLNQVAQLQNVRVLNINDLAMALKPNILPREMLELLIVKEGNQWGQGVGYLEDGTMVVVEHGKAHLNETIGVKVTQVIQTERGKMIFAEVPQDEDHDLAPRSKPRHGR